MRYARSAFAAIAVVLVSATMPIAQVNWMSPLHEPGVSLDISKVSWEEDQHMSFMSIQYSLASRIRLDDRLSLLVEVPFSHAGFDSDYYLYYPESYLDQTAFGNPFLGVEMSGSGSSSVFKIGIRAPFAPRSNFGALEFGFLSAYDRWEAYYPKLTTIPLSVGYRNTIPNRSRFQVLFSPTVMIPDKGDAEIFADWNAEFWLTGQSISAGLGMNARVLITESDITFDRRSDFQTAASVIATIGRFHPGIHFRVPLDEGIQRMVNFTYGLNLTVDLPDSGSDDHF